MGAVRKKLRQVASTIKFVFGMPDYDRYLKHWQEHHAHTGERPMTEKEYYLCALRDRYERGGVNRCC
jgi:uncharacterized short protein YbdD (DUF466 family)